MFNPTLKQLQRAVIIQTQIEKLTTERDALFNSNAENIEPRKSRSGSRGGRRTILVAGWIIVMIVAVPVGYFAGKNRREVDRGGVDGRALCNWRAGVIGEIRMNGVRSRMQAIGKAVEAQLPKGYGFYVVCFPFNDPQTQGEYVSNAERRDVVAAMQNFIARNPMQEPGRD